MALIQTRGLLKSLDVWEQTTLEERLRKLVAEIGLKAGQLFGAIRTAVSGRTATPPLFQMMEVLGREVCLQRIDQAIERLL